MRGPARFPYQVEGTKFLSANRRAILADAPGLGKSVQLIDTIEGCGYRNSLIVVPNSLKSNWRRELEKFSDIDPRDIQIIEGSPADRMAQLTSSKRVKIINYEALRLHKDLLPKCKFDCVVWDESHRLKNRTAQVTKVSKALAKSAGTTYFASGTPLTRATYDLWTVLNMIDSKKWGSFWKFVERYAEKYYNGFAWDVRDLKDPDDPRFQELRSELAKVFIRRELSEVFPEFPDLTVIKRVIDIDDQTRKQYERMKKEALVEIKGQEVFSLNALTTLLRLKQILLDENLIIEGRDLEELSGAKYQAVLDILDEIGDEPLVIFTQFASAIAPLIRSLASDGFKAVEFSGQISNDQCNENEAQWKRGDAQILVASIDKGGVGHTWTRAQYGIFLDKKYLPYENEQARKRLHRISQDRPVFIWELLCSDTIEEKIERVLEEREEIFDTVITRTMLLRLLEEK